MTRNVQGGPTSGMRTVASYGTAALVDQVQPSGFSVLRTPLLPFDEIRTWTEGVSAVWLLSTDPPDRWRHVVAADRALLIQRLALAVGRPEVREAIRLASPGFAAQMEAWLDDPGRPDADKIARTAASYLMRMASRSTPFGLFAGGSHIEVGEQTKLCLAPRRRYRRHTQVNIGYLAALADSLTTGMVAAEVAWHPNPSLYRAAGHLRFISARPGSNPDNPEYHLVAVEPTPYLDTVLEHAATGRHCAQLVQLLVDDGYPAGEAGEYVAQLITTGILVGDLAPAVTGLEPLEALAVGLRSHGPVTEEVASRLDAATVALRQLDKEGCGAPPNRYDAVTDALPHVPTISADAATGDDRLLVDLVKPAPGATLGQDLLAEITRGARLLHVLGAEVDQRLDRFRRAFADRYGDREVALLEALDSDVGVGFGPEEEACGAGVAGTEDLPDGLTGLGQRSAPRLARWGQWHDVVLRHLLAATRDRRMEIDLTEDDISELTTATDLGGSTVPSTVPLPTAFAVLASVSAVSAGALDRGEFMVSVDRLIGPSGARYLGRFCHANPAVHDGVREHLRQEETAMASDSAEPRVFAEVVYLPAGGGRVGNVAVRPVLRDYEICCLGRSGAPAGRQIPLSDLVVAVDRDRIVLRSQALGCEVVPRLTSAHNHRWLGPSVYRFLCALQTDGTISGAAWSWGPLAAAPFHPRVRAGRVVLARAQWRLQDTDVRYLCDLSAWSPAEAFRRVQGLRRRLGLPRWIVLVEGPGRERLVDLDNVLSVEDFTRTVRRMVTRRATRRDSPVVDQATGDRGWVRLVEMFPQPNGLTVSGPEGHFVHQLVVPCVRLTQATSTATTPTMTPTGSAGGGVDPSAQAAARPAGVVRRRFPPGSDWLYLKLYCGQGSADRILRQTLAPLISNLRDEGVIDRWFFVRYGDEAGWHLRVRVHGQSARLHREAQPVLAGATEPLLTDGRIWRTQFDTYEREVERYGGPQGIELAETVFAIDSDAVLSMLTTLSSPDSRVGAGVGPASRWQLALVGVDALLTDFGISLGEKQQLMRRVAASRGREFGATNDVKRQLGQRFRDERPELEDLLARRVDRTRSPRLAIQAVDDRSARLTPAAAELADLARHGRLTRGLPELVWSHCHLHVNRLLPTAQRAHELALCSMLERIYRSRLARGEPAVTIDHHQGKGRAPHRPAGESSAAEPHGEQDREAR